MSEQPDEQPTAGRSGDIEIICALGCLVALCVIPQAFAHVWRQSVSWRSLLDIAFPFLFVVCLVGFDPSGALDAGLASVLL